MANISHLAVFDDQQAVFEILIGLLNAHHGWVGNAVQDGGAVGFHWASHVTLISIYGVGRSDALASEQIIRPGFGERRAAAWQRCAGPFCSLGQRRRYRWRSLRRRWTRQSPPATCL